MRDLRHYFAVQNLVAGVPLAIVSAWMGHSSVQLTVKRYGRWAAEAREQWRWAKAMGEPGPSAEQHTRLPEGSAAPRQSPPMALITGMNSPGSWRGYSGLANSSYKPK